MRYEEREFITMYQIDYTNVGKRMKTLRKQAGYTQEQIADALDVTVAFISNIENDRVKMNLRVLSYYAKLLNVSIDYLLRPESDENGEKDDVLKKVSSTLQLPCPSFLRGGFLFLSFSFIIES